MSYERIHPLSQRNPARFEARIPGSKSYTNRALVLAAERVGRTRITGALHSQDTTNLAAALGQIEGLDVTRTPDGFTVTRSRETLGAPRTPLDLGGAGTPARLLLSFAAALEGSTVVTGNARLRERPMAHLLTAMGTMGIRLECLGTPGCLPVRVHGGAAIADVWEIDGSVSSQFVTSLLLFAAQQERPVQIAVTGRLVSRPYVEMTVRMMRSAGLGIDHDAGMRRFRVEPGQPQVDSFAIEADASAMSYFLAAAALTQTTVRVQGIGRGSAQGDVGLAEALAEMGCRVAIDEDSIVVGPCEEGRSLRGIDIDMDRMPDVVLTLAVVAARARGTTRIRNIGNLRVKECDRIAAAAKELTRLGVAVDEGEDFLVIRGSSDDLRPARVETYDDHRVAMSFGLLRLLEPRIEIEDPACVSKSFADFWEELARFVAHHDGGEGRSA